MCCKRQPLDPITRQRDRLRPPRICERASTTLRFQKLHSVCKQGMPARMHPYAPAGWQPTSLQQISMDS